MVVTLKMSSITAWGVLQYCKNDDVCDRNQEDFVLSSIHPASSPSLILDAATNHQNNIYTYTSPIHILISLIQFQHFNPIPTFADRNKNIFLRFFPQKQPTLSILGPFLYLFHLIIIFIFYTKTSILSNTHLFQDLIIQSPPM
ncbi:hypothetical protein QVD17_09936 [Tagetes erecta]|uniref:Uncharacterized protein n=1 Tax=Tagetes erecta TaxID=13708 RepID=A0AAD8L6X3_TARER|nr:hypothetical protein QVD17_09936 [Tagetes erecta]